jgi:NAD(P)-dependent dehydrogenase (short-subunit alcohol dehydrogenase family)
MPNINPINADQPPTSKVVLVTGAAVRIGREIALHFARQGWHVAVHYSRSSAQAFETVAQINALEPADSLRAIAFQADLADQEQVKQLVPAVVAKFGRLDVLVNNASRFEFDDVDSLSFESLNAHIGPNLAAPIMLAHALHQALSERAEGAVVNLLDQKLYNLNPDFFSYTMSKAGLAAATTMLAQALAPRVRVVGVAPGLTLPSYLQDEATFDAAHKVSILERSSDVQDIAASIYFAATNRSMTGSTLLVDGGQHLLALPRDISFMNINGASQLAPAQLDAKS